MNTSACGAVKEQWLADWKIKPEDAEEAWKAKLALDEKIVSQGDQIRQNFGIIPEIQPYRSQIDGSMITSRKQHRNHLKENKCIEVGNEKQQNKKPEEPKGLRDAIGKAVYQHLG
jgi:hypothetical protein